MTSHVDDMHRLSTLLDSENTHHNLTLFVPSLREFWLSTSTIFSNHSMAIYMCVAGPPFIHRRTSHTFHANATESIGFAQFVTYEVTRTWP
jgi:hypothetical protein